MWFLIAYAGSRSRAQTHEMMYETAFESLNWFDSRFAAEMFDFCRIAALIASEPGLHYKCSKNSGFDNGCATAKPCYNSSRTYNRSEPKKYAIQYKHPAKFQRLDLEMLMRTLNSSQAGIA